MGEQTLLFQTKMNCLPSLQTLNSLHVKVLIVPDKFKGTLTAREAAEAIARGWRSVRPHDQLELLPMSDGGDGFGEIIGAAMNAQRIEVQTTDAAGRPRTASYWFDGTTAVIETAQVNGLALLPHGQYHPFQLDTFGLGKVFQSALEFGAKRALVGIGGSATNDGGFGLARAIGWKFFDEQNEISNWTDLDHLVTFHPLRNQQSLEVTIACDVQNPLLGPNGASRIYGPQKGLREEEMPKAEACLDRLAQIVSPAAANEPGTGAAGGLGYGLRVFLNGQFVPGAEVFAQAARLDERLPHTDLLISGEGALDAQSLMGKGVGEILELARKAKVKRLALAGSLAPAVAEKFGADPKLQLLGIVPNLTNLEEAKACPAQWLATLAAQAAQKYG